MEGKEDAMKKRICVTEEDIKNGVRMGAAVCPVALALLRATGVLMLVHPDDHGWSATVAGGGPTHPLPERVGQFAYWFDYGCQMRPIEFELDLPEAS